MAISSTTIYAALGSLWSAYQLFRLTNFIYLHFLRSSSLSRYKSDSPAAWALVTGSSDGIGKGFAEELCHQGFNVIIHGRNEKKLNAVKADLLQRWPQCEVRIMIFDASRESDDLAKLDAAVQQQLQGLNLTVLVNNVGGGAGTEPILLAYQDNPPERIRTFLDLNSRFTSEITQRVLPHMVARKKSPSLIINIGSVASDVPSPYLSVYAGAKAYIKAWSRSLALEMKAQGTEVEVLHIMVGMVDSGGTPRATSFIVPSSRRMAQGALDKVGCGLDVVFGYWPHELQYHLINDIPATLGDKLMMDMILKMKKEEEEKKYSKSQ